MGNPALILVSVLVRTVDAAHAEDDGRQREAGGEVEDVLVSAALRAAVRRPEGQRPRFVDSVVAQPSIRRRPPFAPQLQLDLAEAAVDLVRGREDDGRRLRKTYQLLE